MTKSYPGFPEGAFTSENPADLRLKTEINPSIVIQGNTLDRVAVQALQYRDDAVARGIGFYTYWETESIPVGGKVYAKFVTPPNRYVGLLFREATTDKERFFYRVYTGFSNATAGSAIRIGNLRGLSVNVSTSQLNIVTTVPDLTLATEVTILPIFGTVNAGNRGNGSLANNNVFRLIPPNTEFLIEKENGSTEAIYNLVELNWLELPEVVIPDEIVLP